MKTNRIKTAAFAVLLVSVIFAGCSNMIQLLRIHPLNIVSSTMSAPGNIVSIKVTDDIPGDAVPTIT